ncbi:hypothetical protein JB92DRAFT_2827420 [Gautieria morchelliformis]|nr:hypothetical protein JB92DRAFT_2827420 [Gautieria morchelliformis]
MRNDRFSPTLSPILNRNAPSLSRLQIIVTQPHRVAALSVASCVSAKRGDDGSVGYTIRGEGVVLRRLTIGNGLEGVRVVVVDEVHERSIDSDFLLLELREISKKDQQLEVVLVSVTINQKTFGTLPACELSRPLPVRNAVITTVVAFVVTNKEPGAILIFIPGVQTFPLHANLCSVDIPPVLCGLGPTPPPLPALCSPSSASPSSSCAELQRRRECGAGPAPWYSCGLGQVITDIGTTLVRSLQRLEPQFNCSRDHLQQPPRRINHCRRRRTHIKLNSTIRSTEQDAAVERCLQYLKGLTHGERRLLQDVEPYTQEQGWHVLSDGMGDDGDEVQLDDPEWENIDASHAGGEYEAFHELSMQMNQITGRHSTTDYRTRRDRLHRMHEAWKEHYDGICDAFLRWEAEGSPPCSEDNVEHTVSILCFDILSQTFRTFQANAANESVNITLAHHGYIGSSPFQPALAFSFSVLALFMRLSARCPQLSVQAFVRAPCDIHIVPYRPYLRNQTQVAIGVYYETQQRTTDEQPLKYSMLTTMDANNSLKRVEQVRHERNSVDAGITMFNVEQEDGRFLSNRHCLSPMEVDKYKDELSSDVEDNQDTATATPVDGEDSATPCVDRWKAAAEDSSKSMWGVFDETGVFVALCRHGTLLLMCDMIKSGELAKYPLAIINRLMENFGPHQLTGYDIGCSFAKTANNTLITGPEIRKCGHEFICGSFHGHAHCRLCQLDWHPLYREGCGLEEFEGCERAFYESNALARRTRYASKFHRQQAIQQHFERWNADKHETLINIHVRHSVTSRLSQTNLKKLNTCLVSHPTVLTKWRCEEKAYLISLEKEPPTDILKIQYLGTLKKLRAAEKALDAISSQWRHTPATDLQQVTFYRSDWQSTSQIESAHISGLDSVLLLQKVVDDLEIKLDIDHQWEPGSEEWKHWEDYLVKREYHRAVDVLEGLVVSQLFELTKMNQSETGYKLRVKIANALKARSAAIRTAIMRYNEAAMRLSTPRPPLDTKTVLEYVFLAEFDLLRDSQHQVQDRPWSWPVERIAMTLWFKIQRSQEELDRVVIETCRLKTWMHDEEVALQRAIENLEGNDPSLAHQLQKKLTYIMAVNEVHRAMLKRIQRSPLWSGPQGVGVRLRPEAQSESLMSPDQENKDEVVEHDLSSENGENDDDLGDDDSQTGPRAILMVATLYKPLLRDHQNDLEMAAIVREVQLNRTKHVPLPIKWCTGVKHGGLLHLKPVDYYKRMLTLEGVGVRDILVGETYKQVECVKKDPVTTFRMSDERTCRTSHEKVIPQPSNDYTRAQLDSKRSDQESQWTTFTDVRWSAGGAWLPDHHLLLRHAGGDDLEHRHLREGVTQRRDERGARGVCGALRVELHIVPVDEVADGGVELAVWLALSEPRCGGCGRECVCQCGEEDSDGGKAHIPLATMSGVWSLTSESRDPMSHRRPADCRELEQVACISGPFPTSPPSQETLTSQAPSDRVGAGTSSSDLTIALSPSEPSLQTGKWLAVKRKTLRQAHVQQKKCTQISRAERRKRALHGAAKRAAIEADIKEAWDTQDKLAKHLAMKHGIKVESMQARLTRHATTKYGRHTRKASSWNAFLHFHSKEVNQDLPPGQKAWLVELQSMDSCVAWQKLTKANKEDLVEILEKTRERSAKGIRGHGLAEISDVRHTLNRMEEELKALRARCATSSLAVTVPSKPGLAIGPSYYADEVSERFMEMVYGVSWIDFVTKFNGVGKNQNERMCILKTHCVRVIRNVLRPGQITGYPEAEMSYARYESDIVDRYQVVMEGWPLEGNIRSPFKIGTMKALERLTNALEGSKDVARTCQFRRLSDEEYAAHKVAREANSGAGNDRPRKEHADKGLARRPYQRCANVSNDLAEPAKRQQKAGSRVKSKHIVDSSKSEHEN